MTSSRCSSKGSTASDEQPTKIPRPPTLPTNLFGESSFFRPERAENRVEQDKKDQGTIMIEVRELYDCLPCHIDSRHRAGARRRQWFARGSLSPSN